MNALCDKCGEEVIHIETDANASGVIIVSPQLLFVITSEGKVVPGFLPHVHQEEEKPIHSGSVERAS